MSSSPIPTSPIIQLADELTNLISASRIEIPATRDLSPRITFENIQSPVAYVTFFSVATRRETRGKVRFNELKLLVLILAPIERDNLPAMINKIDDLVSELMFAQLPTTAATITKVEFEPFDHEFLTQHHTFKATLGVTISYACT
jgi:hypothetical protein